MTLQEKSLYHQIHPLKLATDGGATPLALYLFWQHKLLLALGVSLIPSIISSWAIIRFANLAPYQHSRLGRYIKIYMTPPMQALRLTGFVVMAIGAWIHRAWLFPLGLSVVLFGWLRGVLFPRTSQK